MVDFPPLPGGGFVGGVTVGVYTVMQADGMKKCCYDFRCF